MGKAKKPGRISQALKSIRAGLAKLKREGLFRGDVRGAKGGWRQRKLLKTYDDVVKGKAKTVKVGKDAKTFDPEYRPKNNVIVVKAKKDERLRYDRKNKQVVSRRQEYGVSYKRILVKTIRSPQDLPSKPPRGKKWFYRIPHNPLLDEGGMKEFLHRYKDKKGILNAVEIYEFDKLEFPDIEDVESEMGYPE